MFRVLLKASRRAIGGRPHRLQLIVRRVVFFSFALQKDAGDNLFFGRKGLGVEGCGGGVGAVRHF